MLYPYLPSFYGVTSPAQIITPLVYDESISYEQQIAMIFGKISEMSEAISNYLTLTAFKQFVTALDEEQKEQTEDIIKYVNNADAALKVYIDKAIYDYTVGDINIIDPSTGAITSVQTAVSNAYNDLRYWAMTWAEIDAYTENKTWAQLDSTMANYTVREIDLFSEIKLLNNNNPH